MKLPEMGDRVGVRLILSERLMQIREGTVQGLGGVEDYPVYVYFGGNVGAWFQADRIVPVSEPQWCPSCDRMVPRPPDAVEPS